MRIDSDSGTKSWHLVKLSDDVQVKDDGMKMISEIFLTRLLSTKVSQTSYFFYLSALFF